ncbi:hypothetical protein [Sphingomonas sp. dw_22]|uniref:hypothetical protein n=1 Tax=Sphingomonas sp. dw_22 TaxID=2721175 RepID=UPI001BD45B9B|nr:hypothetical protein [Sphingomonas sp. dw_22]
MDRIFFGDNQFFGINHMSEEKARQQMMRFQDINAIADTLHAAYSAGVPGFMCTTHERIIELVELIKTQPGRWDGMKFYPGMPYAHKYANAVTEQGYFDALKQFLPSGGLIDAMMRGGKALVTRDVEGIITLLIDAEMKPFEGMDTPIIFLQNVVTDLVLGLGYYDAYRIFADHVKKKYKAEPGYFSMNLPMLLPALAAAGVENPIVCANVNKVAFRMSGGIEAYREATARHPARVIAMSVLASGAIPPREAIEWVVNEPYVASILFGASSRRNIENTVELIREYDARRAG